MSYAQWHQTFTQKVRDYDWHTCRRALFDCHDTLNLWGSAIAEDYATKLWAEIDALREQASDVRAAAFAAARSSNSSVFSR